MIRRAPKRKNHLLTIIFLLMTASIVLIYVLMLDPQYREIKTIESRIEEISETIEANSKDAMKKRVTSLEEKVSSAKKEMSRFIVSPSQALDLTVDIGRIAQKARVNNLRSANRMLSSYSSINECEHVREGRMQIDFTGSFGQFAIFLNLLERNEPVIFVDYFKITRSKTDNMSHEVEMVLTFFIGQESVDNLLAKESGTAAIDR